MTVPLYALVGYVGKPVADFVHELRRELQPEASDVPAHLTILPPRPLFGAESQAIELIDSVCSGVQPFDVSMGDVENFMPSTATVFIRVAHAAYRMRELHDRLNTGPLKYDEPWPYMPHLTIFRMYDMVRAQAAFLIARERWDNYGCARSIRVEELTFVRQASDDHWIDLAPVPLGRSLALT
jgi:2'-5' RNA ligase